jgi:hypothetical protein
MMVVVVMVMMTAMLLMMILVMMIVMMLVLLMMAMMMTMLLVVMLVVAGVLLMVIVIGVLYYRLHRLHLLLLSQVLLFLSYILLFRYLTLLFLFLYDRIPVPIFFLPQSPIHFLLLDLIGSVRLFVVFLVLLFPRLLFPLIQIFHHNKYSRIQTTSILLLVYSSFFVPVCLFDCLEYSPFS